MLSFGLGFGDSSIDVTLNVKLAWLIVSNESGLELSEMLSMLLNVFLSISQCHALCLPSESLASDPILWISYSLTAPIPQGHHDYPNLFEKREWEGTARTPYLNPNPICPLFFNGQTPLLPPVSSSISSPPSIQWSFWSFSVLEKNYFLLHIVSFPTLFLV